MCSPRHGEARPQQLGNLIYLPLDQAMRIEADLEARSPFGRTADGDASLQEKSA
jgi:hypothetical protein